MKKLFFSVLALAMGAVVLVSCEKDKNEDNNRGDENKYLSLEAQQEVISQSLNGVVNAVSFDRLGQTVEFVFKELSDYNILLNRRYIEKMAQQDPILVRKIEAVKQMFNLESDVLNLDFTGLYMEADIAFRDSIKKDTLYSLDNPEEISEIRETTFKVPYLTKPINHQADKFQLNITTPDDHKLVLTLKVHTDDMPRLSLISAASGTKAEASRQVEVFLPDQLDVLLTKDGETVIGLDAEYTTDFHVDYGVNDLGKKSLQFLGNNLNLKGNLALLEYAFDFNAVYNFKEGLKVGVTGKKGSDEIANVNVYVNGKLYDGDLATNWLDKNSILAWVVDYNNTFKGLSVDASLGGGKIKVVASLENPIKYQEAGALLTGLALGVKPNAEDIATGVAKFNEIFKGEIYFSGFDEPQARIRLAYEEPEGDVPFTFSNIAKTGFYFNVETYDAQGKEITVSMKEYLSKVDFSAMGQSIVEKLKSTFMPILTKYTGKSEQEIKKMFEELLDELKKRAKNGVAYG